MFHNYDIFRDKGAIQIGSMKLIVGDISKTIEAEAGYLISGADTDTMTDACFAAANAVEAPSPLSPVAALSTSSYSFSYSYFSFSH